MPGETAQVVFEVPWQTDRLSIPVHFRIVYRPSEFADGVLKWIRRLPAREGVTLVGQHVYGLAVHPFLEVIKEEVKEEGHRA